ncbi:hypothetical protein M426DRAFT_7619 [Hypoxylon sp. CI-4A]|nr:hypothetical protein M426DRAFT_7619 [Hypoxylon sp. CI-4A]
MTQKSDQATKQQEDEKPCHSSRPSRAAISALLLLGYFENSKIGAQEKELGPKAASLSLGSPSVVRAEREGKDKDRKFRKPILSLLLEHGDIVVMNG